MNKLTGIAVLASIILCSAFVFAALEFRKMTVSFAALEERVVRVETATVSPRENASTQDGSANRPPATIAGVADEIGQLRKDVAALRQDRAPTDPSVEGNPAAVPPGHAGPPVNTSDVARAVTDALAAKEKSDKEKQARAYRKQMEASAKSYAATLAKQFDLTELQKSQVGDILAEQWTKMSTAWTEVSEDENAQAVDYQKLQDETNARVKAVMTQEQAARYDEFIKKQQQGWGGGEVTPAETEDSQK